MREFHSRERKKEKSICNKYQLILSLQQKIYMLEKKEKPIFCT